MPSHVRSLPLGLLAVSLLVVGATLGLAGLAHGADDDAAGPVKPAAFKELRAKVESLEKDVAYLRAREESLTRYIVGNEALAGALEAAVKRSRSQGFENKAMPAESRVTLLRALEDMAHNLRKNVPVLSKEEERLLRAAKAPAK